MLFGNTPGGISNRKLKHGFGQIDGHGSSIHDGLLSLTADPHPHANQHAYFGAKRRGESIPSIERTVSIRLRLLPAAAHVKR
jgi:hypothetical protein